MSDTSPAPEATPAPEASPEATPAPEAAPTFPYANLFSEDGTIAANAGDAYREEWPEHAPRLAKFAGKTLKDVMDSYGSLEARLGKAATATFVPGEDATDEERAAYRQAIGAPDVADGYGLHEAPEGHEGEWDGEFGKALNEILHKGNVPLEVAQELAARYNEEQSNVMAAIQKEEEVAAEAEAAELREMWGDAYEAEMSNAERIAKGFGFDLKDFTANDVAVLLAKIGRAANEDVTVQKALNLSETRMAGDNPRVRMDEIARDERYQKQIEPHYSELRKEFHKLAQQAANQPR